MFSKTPGLYFFTLTFGNYRFTTFCTDIFCVGTEMAASNSLFLDSSPGTRHQHTQQARLPQSSIFPWIWHRLENTVTFYSCERKPNYTSKNRYNQPNPNKCIGRELYKIKSLFVCSCNIFCWYFRCSQVSFFIQIRNVYINISLYILTIKYSVLEVGFEV